MRVSRAFPPGAALAVLALLCGLLASFVPSPRVARALVNCDTSTAGISASEQEMFRLINEARAAAGVPALKLSPGLNRMAAWKSADRSAWGTTPQDPLFSHRDSLGRGPSDRARDCGFPGEAAENIAYGWG